MRRRAGIAVCVAGAGAVAASFFLPIDFAWSGVNTFDSCISTSRYASGTAARLVWLGFAAAVLYQYVWAAASGAAFALEWRHPSRIATRIAVIPAVLGGLLVALLGTSLLLMREAWPAPQIQLAAAVLPLVHVGLLAFAVRRAATVRKTSAAVLAGGIPFLALNAGLGVTSFRYDSPVWGFAIAGTGVIAMLAASCLLLKEVRMKRIVVLAVCFVALTVGVRPASGQPPSETVTNLFTMPFDELIQVPVTVASRHPETVFSSPGTVYVVTREEIQRFGWRDLSELLKATVPNLYGVYDGGRHPFGARGFDFDGPRILVMIDGRVLTGYVFANSVYLGDGFSALNIERVEILMGPNSMLYGSSALEAVVNVVTRSGGAGGADATEVNIMRGDGNVQQNSVLARRVTADSEMGFHYADYVADQDWPEWARYYGGNDYIASRPPPTHTAFQQHKEDRMVNMYARYKGLYAGYNYWRMDAAPDAFEAPWTYTTGAYTRRDIWEFSVPYIGYSHDFFRGLRMNVEMEYRYFNRDKFISVDAFDQPAGKVDHERQMTPVYKAHVEWTPGLGHSLSFGAENRRPKLERADRVQGADGGEYGFNQAKTIEDKATTLFVQDLVTIVPEKLTLTAGLSYNHFDSVTNDTWTPRASLVWMTDRESSLKFTYGEGVREDTLARPCGDPERLRMTEINYSSTMRFLGAKAMNIAAAYHMKYENMARSAFIRQPDTASGSWTSVRIPSLEVYGIEDMLRLSWSRADAFLSVNMNDREEEPTRVGDMRAYVPSYIVKAGVSYRVMEHLLAAASAVRFGSANSYMQTASSEDGAEYARSDLPPWTKVDVNLRLDRFNLGGMDSALSLRVGNVFNEDGLMHYAVEQARGLLIEPRTVRVELNLAF